MILDGWQQRQAPRCFAIQHCAWERCGIEEWLNPAAIFWRSLIPFMNYRGSNGIRAFFAHGMPLHELPSLIWPLYHLIALISLLAALGYGVFHASTLYPLAALAFLVSPSLALSAKTCLQVRRPTASPAL